SDVIEQVGHKQGTCRILRPICEDPGARGAGDALIMLETIDELTPGAKHVWTSWGRVFRREGRLEYGCACQAFLEVLDVFRRIGGAAFFDLEEETAAPKSAGIGAVPDDVPYGVQPTYGIEDGAF